MKPIVVQRLVLWYLFLTLFGWAGCIGYWTWNYRAYPDPRDQEIKEFHELSLVAKRIRNCFQKKITIGEATSLEDLAKRGCLSAADMRFVRTLGVQFVPPTAGARSTQ